MTKNNLNLTKKTHVKQIEFTHILKLEERAQRGS